MATSLRTRIHLQLSAILDAGVTGVNAQAEIGPGVLDETITFVDGNGSGQANRIYYAERTLTAGSNETLDLAGVLLDVYGNTLTFAKVYAIAVKNVGTVASRIEFGPNSSNGFGTNVFFGGASHRVSVNISSGLAVLYAPAGATVTAGTGDLLYVENMSAVNAATYRIAILGTN
jgi:hypothetical protein